MLKVITPMVEGILSHLLLIKLSNADKVIIKEMAENNVMLKQIKFKKMKLKGKYFNNRIYFLIK
jgi:hypothetical protein